MKMIYLARTGLLAFFFCLAGCGDGDDVVGSDATDGVSEDTLADVSDLGEEVIEPPQCPESCDDGQVCTDDSCQEGVCIHAVLAGTCFADGLCWDHGELHLSDPCLVCDPTANVEGWSGVPDGMLCDDGTPCTLDDYCEAGACTGKNKPCDDGNLCTDDSCDSVDDGICLHASNTLQCDDEDPCTEDDFCTEGGCLGTGNTCDDGDLCTNDFCAADGDCSYMDLVCNDDNPCTLDVCDAVVGCVYSPTDGAPCEAGNYCVLGDICVQDSCVEGSTPAACEDDENPCTESTCLADVGCVHLLNHEPCDDGFDCTEEDTCMATICKGAETDTCADCVPESFSPDVQKATLLVFGAGGYPGEGMDVDGNPDTCAPALTCSDGIDNALGVLASVLNPLLEAATSDGAIAPIMELHDIAFDGSPFSISILNGVFDESGPACDFQEETCSYLILNQSYGPDCVPSLIVDNAVIEDNHLSAGGPGVVMVMDLPVSGSKPHHLFIVGGRLELDLVFDPTGTQVISMDGMVVGAVPKQELLSMVATIDPSYFPGSTTEEMVGLVDVLVEQDIDLDGDGVMDAASIGLRVKTIPGVITGVVND